MKSYYNIILCLVISECLLLATSAPLNETTVVELVDEPSATEVVFDKSEKESESEMTTDSDNMDAEVTTPLPPVEEVEEITQQSDDDVPQTTSIPCGNDIDSPTKCSLADNSDAEIIPLAVFDEKTGGDLEEAGAEDATVTTVAPEGEEDEETKGTTPQP